VPGPGHLRPARSPTESPQLRALVAIPHRNLKAAVAPPRVNPVRHGCYRASPVGWKGVRTLPPIWAIEADTPGRPCRSSLLKMAWSLPLRSVRRLGPSAGRRVISVRLATAIHGHTRPASVTPDFHLLDRNPYVCARRCGIGAAREVVVRGGVEPPTFRFSGLRIRIQVWPCWSSCLLGARRQPVIDGHTRT
jgi:hypothetical protein